METVVAVAIGILSAICVGAALTVALLCKHRYCGELSFLKQYGRSMRPEVSLTSFRDDSEQNEDLMDNMDEDNEEEGGLIPHCLDILKLCHKMTERLVAMTVKNASETISPEKLSEIIAVARKITPRVDDVVKSLYPPLDPILIEARATALHLSVNHLVLVCKGVLHHSAETLDWVEADLSSMGQHLDMVREIASDAEAAIQHVNQMQLQAALANMATATGGAASGGLPLGYPSLQFSVPQV